MYFPYLHRQYSRSFLMECFSDASVRVDKDKGQMPENMREGVFNVWYDTDMASAAGGVWLNLSLFIVTVVIGGGLLVIGAGAVPSFLKYRSFGSRPKPASP